jgi:hypothetical protein
LADRLQLFVEYVTADRQDGVVSTVEREGGVAKVVMSYQDGWTERIVRSVAESTNLPLPDWVRFSSFRICVDVSDRERDGN